MKKIKSFKNEYYFLSNMYPCSVMFEGKIYPSAESAFQAAKLINPEERNVFTSLDGYKAKRLGRKVVLRPDWENIKVNIMYQILLDKFTRNSKLKIKLLQTEGSILIEGNTWNDTFWGFDIRKKAGENILGQLLMDIRADLISKERKQK